MAQNLFSFQKKLSGIQFNKTMLIGKKRKLQNKKSILPRNISQENKNQNEINSNQSSIKKQEAAIIEFINSRDPEFFTMKDQDLNNLIHICLWNKYPSEIILALLEKDPDLASHLASEKNNRGQYPLQYALMQYWTVYNNNNTSKLKEDVILKLLEINPNSATEKVLNQLPIDQARSSRCSSKIINAIQKIINSPSKNVVTNNNH